jgi:hypothetical protein
MALEDLPVELLLLIVEFLTDDFWQICVELKGEVSQACDGDCHQKSVVQLGAYKRKIARRNDGAEAYDHSHHAYKWIARYIEIANKNRVPTMSVACRPELHRNPWVFQLGSTSRSMRARVLEGVMLRCVKVHQLDSKEVSNVKSRFKVVTVPLSNVR